MSDDQRSSGPVNVAWPLHALRRSAGLSQMEAARSSGITQSKLSRIETGKALPTTAEVEALCRAYGASPGETERLASAAASLASQFVDSRVILQEGAHHFQRRVRETEAEATLIRSYQPVMVLGVLQTPAYASVVFTPDEDLSEEEAAESVAERMSRWQLLTDPSRRWRLIQTEAALRWIVRSPALMVGQLDRIAEAGRLPNVDLGIVPLDTVAVGPAPLHGFHIYDDTSVIFGTETGTALLTEANRVGSYVELFTQLEHLAVFGDAARELLAGIITEYRSK